MCQHKCGNYKSKSSNSSSQGQERSAGAAGGVGLQWAHALLVIPAAYGVEGYYKIVSN